MTSPAASQSSAQSTDLSGKTALVTGAGSGIGAAIARALVERGASVHAVDRDAPALDRLRQDCGAEVNPWVVDLNDLDAITLLPAEVDVLVNNAGIQHVAPVHEFPV